jgi:hypothetical protein
MPEIAAPIVSEIGTLSSLVKVHHEVWKWEEQDVQVDGDWLEFAIRTGRLEGATSDYTWVSRPHVLAAELKGTHSRVQAVDVEKRVRYRILHGSFPHAAVLMKNTGRTV